MFVTGDRVVYPLHGGAVVTGIQYRELDGASVGYYILQMLFENMTISVPVANAEKLGLRSVGDADVLQSLSAVLKERPDVRAVKSISWNRRFQYYMTKIKSGELMEVAKIYKILTILEGEKKISVGERRLLHSTKQILQSEIMLIKNVDAGSAESWLAECCK
ncbi:MAG: CarD family transcriptional regulator [Acidaminococcaceae bacterium]|nr:CarD family transcriptional regulator [Acidaminococcaceae bacterium]